MDKTEREEKATPGQIQIILNALFDQKGLRGPAQDFIDRHIAKKCVMKPRKFRLTLDDPRVAYLESHYPLKGMRLAGLLVPLCGWRPRLRPFSPEIAVEAVEAFRTGGMKRIEYNWITVKDEEKDHVVAKLLRKDLSSCLTDMCEHQFFQGMRHRGMDPETFSNPLGTFYVENDINAGFSDFWLGYGSRLREVVSCAYNDVRYYACAAIVTENRTMEERMRTLLKVMRRGHFPIGFDRAARLLILTA